MDWGLRSHPDYQEDYWIGDNGASSHMVGDDKDHFAKTPIEGKDNTANGTSTPMVCKGKMNVEAIPKQDKSSKRVLTIRVASSLALQLLFFMIGRCMGQRKKMMILRSSRLMNASSQLCLIES